MRLLALLLCLGCCRLPAQTTVYLRDNPAAFTIVAPGCTNTTPVVCTVNTTAGLTVGDVVSIAGVCAGNPSINNVSPANGIRKVKAIGTGTITLQDLAGSDVAGNGDWCDGSTPQIPAGDQHGGKLSPYPLVSGVKGYLDGGQRSAYPAVGTRDAERPGQFNRVGKRRHRNDFVFPWSLRRGSYFRLQHHQRVSEQKRHPSRIQPIRYRNRRLRSDDSGN